MKTSSFFALILVALMTFSFSSVDRLCPLEENALCGATILTDCVGTCGNGFKRGVIAPVSGLYCLEATSSLCPNTGAMTRLAVNGTIIFAGDASGGMSLNFYATAGSVIKLGSELFNKKSNVVCVWLGNVNFTLRRP
ncbi:MAG TPA: hypothetical protein ENJ82_07135 [Bacteroidetes bacterium]|nr:hypothetical protein [Bacteroidota bacterium]